MLPSPGKSNYPVSRSDIRIDSDGHWFYRGMRMVRQDIVQYFYRNLMLEDSGTYAVRIGHQSCPINVEDAAFVVWNIHCVPRNSRPLKYIDLLLSDSRTERLDPETIYIGKNEIPYCRIRKGLHRARFSKPAYYKLAEHIRFDPERDRFYLEINRREFYLGPEHL